MEASLIRRLPFRKLPTLIMPGELDMLLMSSGTPLAPVISVLMVLPGLLGSSMPMIILACVLWVAKRRVARRVAVVSCLMRLSMGWSFFWVESFCFFVFGWHGIELKGGCGGCVYRSLCPWHIRHLF